MSQPLVPLCLVHSVPHPCVECRQDRDARVFFKVPMAEVGGAQADDALAVAARRTAEDRELEAQLAKLEYVNGLDRRARAVLDYELAQKPPLVRFKRFHDRAVVPEYAKPGDAGADLRAVESVRLKPFEPVKVRLGVGVELPPGYEAQLRGRSGLSSQGVHVEQGTIDQGYRGELQATLILLNRGYADYEIHIGDKVAQLVVAPVARATFVEGELGESERGAGGFGSTGR
jgi:dUTP pyrophosphatase